MIPLLIILFVVLPVFCIYMANKYSCNHKYKEYSMPCKISLYHGLFGDYSGQTNGYMVYRICEKCNKESAFTVGPDEDDGESLDVIYTKLILKEAGFLNETS